MCVVFESNDSSGFWYSGSLGFIKINCLSLPSIATKSSFVFFKLIIEFGSINIYWCLSRQRNWGVPITLVIHKETGEILTSKAKKTPPKYQDVFGETIIELAKVNENIVGVTPAMLTGSSLNKMIAGNIKIEDITNFNDKDYFIDLSGSLENELGKKDLKKINKLLNLQF